MCVEERVEEVGVTVGAGEVRITISDLNVGELTEEEKGELSRIISNYQKEMDTHPESTASSIAIEHKITLTDEIPVSSAPHRLPHSMMPEVEKQIEELFEKGFIERVIVHMAHH